MFFPPLQCFCPLGGYINSRLPAGPDFGVFRPDGSSNANMRLKESLTCCTQCWFVCCDVRFKKKTGTPSPCSDSRQVEENQLSERNLEVNS